MSLRRALTRTGAAATVAVIVVAACLAGCASDSPEPSTGETAAPAAGRGGQIVWGKPAEIQGTDPVIPGDGSSLQVLGNAYEPLVGLDDDLKPTPLLATSWKQTSPTTYVFTIRKGVKFSNGREMTVDDVVGSLRRLVDPDTGSYLAGQFGDTPKITAVGPQQVKVELQEPRAYLVPLLANVQASVLPMKELKEGSFDPAKEVVGTGPFMVKDHAKDESWTLVPNPHYWSADRPKVDELIIRIMPEEAARVAGLRNGTLDIATFDTPDAAQLLEGQPDIEVVVQNTTEYDALMLNAKGSPVLRDPKVREAVALAVDRQKIIDLALGGTGDATAAGPPGFAESCDAASVPFATPDLDRARQQVEEAGAAGKTVTFTITSANRTHPQIAQVIQENLEEIGLKARILQLDQGEWAKRIVETGEFDLTLNYLGAGVDPATAFVWYTPVKGFSTGWAQPDEELARLVEQSVQGTEGDRRAVLQQTCDRIAELGNIIPLTTRTTVIGYRTDKINAIIPPTEAASQPMRRASEFTVR